MRSVVSAGRRSLPDQCPATALGSFKLVGGGFMQVLPVRTAREAAGIFVEVPFAGGTKQFYVQQSLVAR